MPSLDAIVASKERHTIDGRIILPEISKKKKKTTLDLVSYSYGLNTSRETLWLHTSQISSLTHSTEGHPHNVIHDLEVVQTGNYLYLWHTVLMLSQELSSLILE